MWVRTKIVRALPSCVSLFRNQRNSPSTKRLSRRGTNRRHRRTMEESESSAAPSKRERLEAQGREKSQFRKTTQVLEHLHLPPSLVTTQWLPVSIKCLFPWGLGAEEGVGPGQRLLWREERQSPSQSFLARMGLEELLLTGFLTVQMKVISLSPHLQEMGRMDPLWDSLTACPRAFQV